VTALRIVALDLSLAATGLAHTHTHRGEPVLAARTVHTARTKHGSTDMDHERVHKVLVDVAAAAKCRPDLVAIEWLPQFDGKGDTSLRLAELHGVVKHWLYAQRIPYVNVRPPDLKIWATGNGNATKTAVKQAVIAEYGGLVHIGDDNQADAVALLTLALAAYGEPLTRVVNPKRTRALKGVQWPTLDRSAGAGAGMSGDVEARVVAAVDQQLARLRDLVRLARDHRDVHECSAVVPCPGPEVAAAIKDMRPCEQFAQLALAVAELSALGFGLPSAADYIDLTDRAREVLDDDGGTP
jgi:crossover junction endodeoxyribonuclease RuvC